MFCGCELSFGDDPNVHTCPVCLAHPGSLPVVNEQAIQYGIQIGLALGCEIAPRSIFHRKNYFYPDNPKAYQISQYDIPLATNGRLGDIRIHRVHLEEDAAKLVHVSESGRIQGSGAALARRLQPRRHAAGRDRHRAGRPLRRGGARMASAPALDDQGDRRLGREHGGGEPPLRRERVDPPGGLGRARHQDRAQEHELLPLHRARDRRRARAPARPRRGRRRGDPGDAPLRPALGLDHLASLEGGGPRLPLLPRARPGAARADRGDARRGRAARCPSCPASARSATHRSSACPTPTPASSRATRSWASTSRPWWPQARRPPVPSRTG